MFLVIIITAKSYIFARQILHIQTYNYDKVKTKTQTFPCRDIRYREFPDLLFGSLAEEGPFYFDATHFIISRGDARRHSVDGFRAAFRHWITMLCETYGTDAGELFVRDGTSGHMLVDECLALLFVVYVEPAFGAYLLERMEEMMSSGFTVSDTWLATVSSRRFTKEELTQFFRES